MIAKVIDQYGNGVQGVTVNFTESGPGSFASGSSSATGTTDAAGNTSVTLTSPASASGAESVTATIGTAGTACGNAAGSPSGTTTAGNCSVTRNYTYQSTAPKARTIDLTPATATATSGNGTTFTATVKDAAGAGVAGVAVTFSETGPGAINSTSGTTNASGVATVTTSSATTDSGTQTVTASISTASTDCGMPAGTPSGAPAGRCSASSTVTYSPATSTPVTINGPSSQFVRYGTRMVVSGTAPAGSAVTVYFHRAFVAGFTPKPATASSSGAWSVVYSATDDFSYYAQVGTSKSGTVLTRIDPNVSGTNRTVRRGTVITVSGHSGNGSLVNVHVGSAVHVVRTSSTGVWTYTFKVLGTVAIFANRNEHNVHTAGITVFAS